MVLSAIATACFLMRPKVTLHPTPYTLHPTPYALRHPTPYTLHLHPTPYTPRPTPYPTPLWHGDGREWPPVFILTVARCAMNSCKAAYLFIYLLIWLVFFC